MLSIASASSCFSNIQPPVSSAAFELSNIADVAEMATEQLMAAGRSGAAAGGLAA